MEYTEAEKQFYDRLLKIGREDAITLVEKGRSYGDSWKRRGGVGAFMMLARKWDRIENIAKSDGWDIFGCASRNEGDILDDIRDLRRYLTLVEHEVLRDPWREMAPSGLDELITDVDGLLAQRSDPLAGSCAQTDAEIAQSLRYEGFEFVEDPSIPVGTIQFRNRS